MTTHSSIPVWEIWWTEEPSGLQSMGSQKVRHNWIDLACMYTGVWHTKKKKKSWLTLANCPSVEWSMMFEKHQGCKFHLLMEPCSTAAAAAKSLQSCLTLCDPIDGNPPGSSVSGILQARILEWVAISFSNACMHAKSLQSCPTLCDPMDSSPPGSSVHRILQARILEWVAIYFSGAMFYPCSTPSDTQ